MSHIFISYSRKDIDAATKIVDALAQSDLETWIDWKDIPKAEEWLQEIYRGIEAADAFLFLVSPDSLASEICNEELEHAIENGKRILPIIIRNPQSTKDVPDSISKLNWIFCREAQDNFDEAIAEAHKTIQTDYEWLKFHTELQVKALKWQRNKQEKSLLLRGKELEEVEKLANLKTGKEPQLIDIQRKYLWESRQATNRQRRNVTIGIVAISLVIIGIVLYSNFLVREERDRALANQMASVAKKMPVDKFDLSLLLATQGALVSKDFQTLDALLFALQQNPGLSAIATGHTKPVRAVAFSPDGQLIASGSDDGTIRLWDSSSGASISRPFIGHTWAVDTVAFSPDGKQIVSGNAYIQDSIRLWDVARGQEISEFQTEPQPVYSLVFSPDGKHIVCGSDDGIHILDAKTGQQIREPLRGHSGSVYSVAFSPDGEKIASGGVDHTIQLWDANSGRQIGEPFTGHEGPVSSIAFSPDGEKIVSGSWDDSIRFWDIESGQEIGTPIIRKKGFGLSVAFSPDGERIVSGGTDQSVRIWDVQNRELVGIALNAHTDMISSVDFSSDGAYIVSGGVDNKIYIWDANMGNQIDTPLYSHAGAITSIAFSPDGKSIVSGGEDQSIRVWDTDSQAPIGEALVGHTDVVNSVAFSPDGKRIISGSNDQSIRIWNTATGEQIGKPLIGHSGPINSVTFSHDGKRILSGGGDTSFEDNTLRIWDENTGMQIGEPLAGHTNWVMSVAFSPDDELIVSGSNDIRIWDANTGTQIGTPFIRGGWRVAFSPDGKYIVSGGMDGVACLWDTKSGQQIGAPLTSYTTAITSIVFSPDGQYIAIGTKDGIRVLDVSSGQYIGNLITEKDVWALGILNSENFYLGGNVSPNSLSFSPDGKILASGGEDGIIHFWDMDVNSWIAKACQRAGRNLTLQEWNTYYSESIPYEATCPKLPIPDDAQAYLDARALQQKQILTGIVGVLLLLGLYRIWRRRGMLKKA